MAQSPHHPPGAPTTSSTPVTAPSFLLDRQVDTHWIAKTYFLPTRLHEIDTPLARSIEQQGTLEPITLYQGQILDGYARDRINKRLGRPRWAINFEDTEIGKAAAARGSDAMHQAALQYAIAKNLERRHYSPGQLAALAYCLANMRQGERTDLLEPSAGLPKVSQTDAAKLCNVSVRIVQNAGRIYREGTAAHIAAMENGEPLEPIMISIRWRARMHKANLRSRAYSSGSCALPFVCGDCLLELRNHPTNTFDAVTTDPPYGIGIAKAWDKNIPPREYWREIFRVLKPGAFCLAFAAPQHYDRLALLLRESGFYIRDMVFWIMAYKMAKANGLRPAHEPICVAQKPYEKSIEFNMEKWGVGRINTEGAPWDKEAPEHRPANVVGHLDGEMQRHFYAPRVTEQERGHHNNHPSVKPIALMKWLIEIFAPDAGIVLDPFMGTGTTGLAALEAGRRFLGIEQNADYVAIARQRFEEKSRSLSQTQNQ